MPKAIVIGVGNPVIADDALGLVAARSVRDQCPGGVAVAEVFNGGLELMEAMAGYDRAFVVDAIVAGGRAALLMRERRDGFANIAGGDGLLDAVHPAQPFARGGFARWPRSKRTWRRSSRCRHGE